VSYWGVGKPTSAVRESNTALAAKYQPTEIPFGQALATVGTTFRFKQDPDGTIYTITNVQIEAEIWNYEGTVGSWGYDDPDNPGTAIGGGGVFGKITPPWGSSKKGKHLGGGTAFLSDVIMREHTPYSERPGLCGGASYNRRIRYTVTLDKVVGSEGPNSFHPIKNHVDENGKSNIKRGRQIYRDDLHSSLTASVGATPAGSGQWYNLNSYWNASDAAGGGESHQPWYTDQGYNTHFADDITAGTKVAQTWYNDNPNAYIGLHERGLNETTIEIVGRYTGKDREFPISNNPAIWETEPKEDVGLDIYYAASPSYPVQLKRNRWDGNLIGPDNNSGSDEVDLGGQANWYDYSDRGEEIVKVGSWVVADGYQEMKICAVKNDIIFIDRVVQLDDDTISPLTPGTPIRVVWNGEGNYYGVAHDTEWVELVIIQDLGQQMYRIGESGPVLGRTHSVTHGLGYYNCYSYGTGVESNRVRDDFNAVTIDKGVKASMPLAEQYKEERKGSGLIFSGIYNSTSGINRTNEFIQAEPITKDLNPVNGSIQKLFARDTDLVTFCENKVFKILAKKDALFNADGNTNVTSNQAVLGQSIPFSGEYGISRNPESFASESYRVYFTDRDRGAVLRLSKDGLTPISDAGMTDWFRDNLRYASALRGSHDDRDNQYNLTIETADQDGNDMAYTVSYTEKTRGWVSFKSFIHQDGVSHKNIYYTFPSNRYNREGINDPWGVVYNGTNHAEAHQHSLDVNVKRVTTQPVLNSNVIVINDGQGVILEGMNVEGNGIPIDTVVQTVSCDAGYCNVTVATSLNVGVWVENNTELNFTTARNRFYGVNHYSMVKVMFNGDQGSIKRFKTLNYEGSQANVILDNANVFEINGVVIGQDYYDNYPKKGWSAHEITTDLQDGSMKEFIDKENKWFNWIRGDQFNQQGDFLDTSEFSVQGLGYSGASIDPVFGCTDPSSSAYDALANIDDGSCWVGDTGCTDPTALNYCVTCTIDDGSCIPFVYGCTDPLAYNYDSSANTDDGSCIPVIEGCMDPDAFNYIPLTGDPLVDVNTADTPDSCVDVVEGCTDGSASNYDMNANTDDGSCIFPTYGCMDNTMFNYDPDATVDSGNCVTIVDGCTDPNAVNYNYLANTDDGSCVISTSQGCMDVGASNYSSLHNMDCNGAVSGDPGFMSATDWDSCCVNGVGGCMLGSTTIGSQTYSNYDPTATVPCCTLCDGSDNNNCCEDCIYGCMDAAQSNYDANATCDDGSCVPFTYGCTDATATNYNSTVNTDDGSCIWLGCMDDTATNYDATATIDDGSCTYSNVKGCMDDTAVNYNPLATLDDGSCIKPTVLGCTIQFNANGVTASNYDPLATVDDGSCIYLGATPCQDLISKMEVCADYNCLLEAQQTGLTTSGCTKGTFLSIDLMLIHWTTIINTGIYTDPNTGGVIGPVTKAELEVIIAKCCKTKNKGV